MYKGIAALLPYDHGLTIVLIWSLIKRLLIEIVRHPVLCYPKWFGFAVTF
jgi:hypothetical protein